MNTLSITVRRQVGRGGILERERVKSDFNSKEGFWSGLRSKYSNAENRSAETFENRLRNDFPRRLAIQVQHALNIKLVEEYSELREQGPGRAHGFRQLADLDRLALISRIAFTIEDLSYGSLKIELGVPDPDSVLELLGDNVELLGAILDEYVPEAFEETTDLESDQFAFETIISPALTAYARRKMSTSASVPQSSKGLGDDLDSRKREGARFLAGLVRSPLVFPILLICFLWYVDRQDTLAERQIVSGLMQTLVQEQTATVSILKGLADKSTSSQPEQGSKPSAAQTGQPVPPTTLPKQSKTP